MGTGYDKVVVLRLYKTLLSLCRKFDQSPTSKALLFRTNNAKRNYISEKSGVANYYQEIMNKIFVNDNAIFMSPMDQSKNSFLSVMKHEFRRDNKQFEYPMKTEIRVDISFAVIRKLSSLWSSYQSLLTSDNALSRPLDINTTTEKDDQKVPSAKCVDTVFPGILLLAHPLLPGALHRSVVLILEHTTHGSYGVVINKPSRHTVSTAIKNVSENVLDTFGSKKIYFGGKERRFQVLHSVKECGGAPLPNCAKTIYAGAQIGRLVDFCKTEGSKAANAKDSFHFYAGSCVWKGDDLSKEISSGCWIPVMAQTDQVLEMAWNAERDQEILPEDALEDGDIDDSLSISAIAEEDFDDMETSSNEASKKDLWVTILEQLGPQYKHFSELPVWSDINSVESMDGP